MSEFVENPNLPESAKVLILGEKYAKFLGKPLKNAGIEPVFAPDNQSVDYRLSGHADLSIFHLGGERFLLSAEQKGSALEKTLCDLGAEISFLSRPLAGAYPEDARLNVCSVGNALFYCKNSAERRIVDFFTSTSARLIEVKQGYTRCSVCVVNERSIITADRGIAKAALDAGFDSLLISQGYVNLDGFEYGFIGGAAFKLGRNRLAFTGVIDAHPDNDRILAFLHEKGVEPIFLTDLPVFDIGGAIPIIEN